jgi:hypothetical protein
MHLQTTRETDPAPAASPLVRSAFDRVFGTDAWQVPLSWGQVLVTLPNASTWEVPSTIWHLDHSYAHPRDVIWGVNLFLFVADVEPQGGATMVARGSPALVAHFADAHEGAPPRLRSLVPLARRALRGQRARSGSDRALHGDRYRG